MNGGVHGGNHAAHGVADERNFAVSRGALNVRHSGRDVILGVVIDGPSVVLPNTGFGAQRVAVAAQVEKPRIEPFVDQGGSDGVVGGEVPEPVIGGDAVNDEDGRALLSVPMQGDLRAIRCRDVNRFCSGSVRRCRAHVGVTRDQHQKQKCGHGHWHIKKGFDSMPRDPYPCVQAVTWGGSQKAAVGVLRQKTQTR